jgi:hypothetical protein
MRMMARLFSAVVLAAISGCERCPQSQRDQVQIATTSPASAASNEPARICLRLATPSDLRPILVMRVDPTDHFPICTLKLYNTATEPVIVGYTPNCVMVHCGSFELQGPGVTFVHRREVLQPQQVLELDIPSGGWVGAVTNGERQLMIPTTLPTGSYETWATFKVEGSTPSEIASEHTRFSPG